MTPTLPPLPYRALGFDGGLAHAGLAVATVSDSGTRFEWAGVVETRKGSDCLVAEDHHRRATELAVDLARVLDEWTPSVIFAENFSPPRDARCASMLAWSWGVLSGLASERGIPVHGKSPVRLKDALTDDRGAKKPEMIAAALEQYPELQPFFSAQRQDNYEHIADAAAAVHAFTHRR